MKFVDYESLTYDDVLLEPQYTNVRARNTDLTTVVAKGITLHLPIISAPMDTVTESRLAIALAQIGGLGIIHRNLSIEQEAEEVVKVKNAKVSENPNAAVDVHGKLLVGAAVGPGDDLDQRVKALVTAGADLICVDSAQGHSQYVIETVARVRQLYPELAILAGNVGTSDGAIRLTDAGASALRVGLGPGSICTTRIVSGMGVPQLTAVDQIVKVAKPRNIPVIADGGIKNSGAIVKALAVGASAVMLGSLFAKTLEAPGDILELNDKKYKRYRGMGSVGAMVAGSAARYGQQGVTKNRLVAEGVEGLVEYKGTVDEYVHQLIGGVRAGMSYIGANTLAEMVTQARFIRISQAALSESHPHSIMMTDAGKNYER